MKRREPSCELNHDTMRRELRDKHLSSSPCPACGWVLSPARKIYGDYTLNPLEIGAIKNKMQDLADIQQRRIDSGESSAKISDILVLNYEETKFLLELLGEKI